MTLRQAIIVVGIVGATAPMVARAGSDSSVMAVSATVQDGCSITATTMAFPISTPGTSGNTTASAQVALNCTPLVSYDVGMNTGLHAQGNTRRMYDTYLPYEVYSNSKMTAQWGDRTGINTVSGSSGQTGQVILTAYGKIKSTTQTTRAGMYSDYVVVTVNF